MQSRSHTCVRKGCSHLGATGCASACSGQVQPTGRLWSKKSSFKSQRLCFLILLLYLFPNVFLAHVIEVIATVPKERNKQKNLKKERAWHQWFIYWILSYHQMEDKRWLNYLCFFLFFTSWSVWWPQVACINLSEWNCHFLHLPWKNSALFDSKTPQCFVFMTRFLGTPQIQTEHSNRC